MTNSELVEAARAAVTAYSGKPCEYYLEGCAVCDAWAAWERLTREAIKYVGHDAYCECADCTPNVTLECKDCHTPIRNVPSAGAVALASVGAAVLCSGCACY